MPAESKKQQQLFGIAHAIQTGKMKASEAAGFNYKTYSKCYRTN